jgi:hypothetical protein
MTTRSARAVFNGIVNDRGKDAVLGHKLRINKERNWLIALVLHSYAKAAAGDEQTELEAMVVRTFDEAGFGDDLREQGRLFAGMTPDVRQQLFPGRFAELTASTAYTKDDLVADMPTVQASILAMANSTDVDVVGIHRRTAARASFRRPRASVVATHASELLRAVAVDADPSNPAFADPFSIKATSFHCTDETGTDWLGSDEPYWIFGSIGGGVAVTTKSQVFGDVDSGDNRTFASNEGWMWGQQNAAAVLPEGDIGVLVSLWEHDDGDPTKIKAGVAAAFAVAGAVLTASGVAAWVGAVVAGVGAVVQWLLSYLDDDHIADQTFIFSRQTIVDQIGKAGQSFNLTRRFTDGDGDYTLTITVAHVAPQPTTVTVPSVIGMTKQNAIFTIQSRGLVATSTTLPAETLVHPEVASSAVTTPVATPATAETPALAGASVAAGTTASAGAASSAGSSSSVTEAAVSEHSVGGVVHATETTGEASLAPIGTGGGGGGGGGGPIVTFIVREQSPAGGAVVQRGSTVRLKVERFDNL